MKIDIRYVHTQDDLRLQGIHYDPEKRGICVLLIHGMSGNFMENYFGHILGQALVNDGIGYIYSHNRGYNFVNDIATSGKDKNGGYKTQRHGATYERFEECVLDVGAWVKDAENLGYKKIILMGHSLGCNKIIGMILASPSDMVGAAKHDSGVDYDKLTREAKKNVAEGNPGKLLDGFIFGGWIEMGSRAYLDSSVDNSPADIFPIIRNPREFPELAVVDLPILCLVGEKDGVLLKPLDEYFSILESKATACPEFAKAVIKDANHTYDFCEQPMADAVCGWVKKLK